LKHCKCEIQKTESLKKFEANKGMNDEGVVAVLLRFRSESQCLNQKEYTKSFFSSKENKLVSQFFWHNGMEVTFILFFRRPLCLCPRPFSRDYLTMYYSTYH